MASGREQVKVAAMRMAAIAKLTWRAAPVVALAAIALIAQAGPQRARSSILALWARAGLNAPSFLGQFDAADQLALACAALLLAWLLLLLIHGRTKRSTGRRARTMITIFEAVHYLASETRWGWRRRWEQSVGLVHGRPVRIAADLLMLAPLELERQASRPRTRIRIWGTREGSTVSELIPPEFWISNGLRYESCFDPERVSRTDPKVEFAGNAPLRYERLRIERSGVLKTWPRMNFLQRIIRWTELRDRSSAH